MGLKGIGEIIIYVEDMSAQVEFYQDRLGLAVSYPAGCTDYSGEFWVTFNTGPCVLALHGGGSRRLGEDAPKFVFDVDDIESTHRLLADSGVDIGEVFEAAPGVLVANGVDPEGNKFSIEHNSHRMMAD